MKGCHPGGYNGRLYLATKVVSKRPLPVYDKPPVYYLPFVLVLAVASERLLWAVGDAAAAAVRPERLGEAMGKTDYGRYLVQVAREGR